MAVVAIHLFLNRARIRSELWLILAVTLFGVLLEAGFMGAGLIRYAGTVEGQVLPPIWIAALWFGFGTLPNASLAWLKGRWFLQAVLGAVCRAADLLDGGEARGGHHAGRRAARSSPSGSPGRWRCPRSS